MEKTLVINGSPRENGNSAAISEYISKRIDCRIINCCFEDIAHCTGCDGCKDGKCVIPDKMQEIYPLIEAAENIIFVSPLYFSMLTGALLTFASRWQYFYHNPCKNGKKGAVILIGGGSTKDISKAYSTAKIIMRYAGIKDPDSAVYIGTDKQPALENTDFVNKIDKITENMAN